VDADIIIIRIEGAGESGQIPESGTATQEALEIE